MKASILKRLADVAEISKLDLAPGPMSLSPMDDGILAFYRGTYSLCGIKASCPVSELARPVSVSAREFQQLTGLFDDDQDVTVTSGQSSLMIKAKTRKVSLKYNGTPDTEVWQSMVDATPIVATKLSQLSEESAIATQMSANTMSAPILTGVRILAGGKQIGLQAANGSSLIFESQFPAQMLDATTKRFEMVFPADALVTSVKLLKGEMVTIGTLGRSAIMASEDAIIRTPAMGGNWPPMSQVKALDFLESVSIPSVSIKYLTVAARAYKSDGDATIRPTEAGDTIVLESHDSELGQFQDLLPGQITNSYNLDVGDLESVAKICNELVEMQFSDSMALVTTGTRRLYMLLRKS